MKTSREMLHFLQQIMFDLQREIGSEDPDCLWARDAARAAIDSILDQAFKRWGDSI